MKRIFAPAPGRPDGFTLIELLAVITIILLLAGLILGLAGHAQYKAAQSRAQGEIQALSAAIGNYQIDNGTFPRDSFNSPSNTDTLDARNTVKYNDPAGSSTPAYSSTSQFLYQCLCGAYYYKSNNGTVTLVSYDNNAITAGVPRPTTYFPFKDNQLKYNGGVSDGLPTSVVAIADPFGLSYGYSTAYLLDPTKGYNPTFDLWSTAGYSDTQGKSKPPNITYASGTSIPNVSTLWIKNW